MNFELLDSSADFELIVSFLDSVGKDFVPPLASRMNICEFSQKICPPNGIAYGLRAEKRIVAIGGIENMDPFLNAPAFRVIAVADHLRRSSIGAQLFNFVFTKFKENGGCELWGKTWHENAVSRSFLERAEFEFQHEIKNARALDIHEVHYRWKKLE